MKFLANLQNIDRRIMYLLLVIVVAIPLLSSHIKPLAKVIPSPPVPISPEVQGVYDAIEDIPDGKIAIVSIFWSASTQPENGPQTEEVVRHLFRRGVPFLLIPWDQQGTTLAYGMVNDIANEMHKTYGKDWVALGYQTGAFVQVIQGMGPNMKGQLKVDRNGTSLDKIPMMNGINSGRNVGMVVEVTPVASLPAWIAFMGQPYRVPIAYCPTAVMVPEAHNYLDAHQIVGMLPGLIGAAQYERLAHREGFATRAAGALSSSHLLIIVLIILGNLGYFVSRRRTGGS